MSTDHEFSPRPDILIAGAGIIGLSLALELNARGAAVTVLERDTALSHASIAAAGMLAVNDPHNPPALLPLSRFSHNLYPAYLARIEALSGLRVPFQTRSTLQYLSDDSTLCLDEHSLDPRQLAAALLAAVHHTSIVLREHTTFSQSAPSARFTVNATGAWAGLPVSPCKGQMLLVALPRSLPLDHVVRSPTVYIAPRTIGPDAGRALIGATLEDACFDIATHPCDLARLRALAATLLPELASESNALTIRSWAGLRPATPDALPLLGPRDEGGDSFLATGHFRNGILLAPATAIVLADLLEGKPAPLDLAPFHPARFATPLKAAHPHR